MGLVGVAQPALELNSVTPLAAQRCQVRQAKEAEVFYTTFCTDLEKPLALDSDDQRATAQAAAARQVKTQPAKLFN